MAFIQRLGETNDKTISVWYTSELWQWNELGLLPTHPNQDIEYYCTFLGAYEVASSFQGVSALVHGPSGCVESFNSTRAYPGDSKMFKPKSVTTNMKLSDVVYGATKKLSEAIIDLDRKANPSLILILTNCCADIIGENVDSIVKSSSSQTNSDIINIETGGCSGHGFRVGADRVFKIIFDYIAGKTTQRRKSHIPSVNIFTKRISGRPNEIREIEELSRGLSKIGVKVNTVIRLGTTYDELLRIPDAHANATLCYLFGDGPMQQLQGLFGQPYAKTTFPIGLEGTLRWIEAIGNAVGVDSTDIQNDHEVNEYRAKIENARRKYEGRKAFIWLPGEKGLAIARFVKEIGMKPYLYAMSYRSAENLKDTIRILLEEGHDFPSVLGGKQEIMLEYKDAPATEKPLLFMPKKFWTGELPTATVNFYSDPILGFKGIDFLLKCVEKAATNTNAKDYSLFNRFVESRYKAASWEIDGTPIQGIDYPALEVNTK